VNRATSQTDLLEIIYDLSWHLADDFASGKLRDVFSDSRSRFDLLRSWALEFDSAYANTAWEDTGTGYIGAVSDFYHKKVKANLESGQMAEEPIREVIVVAYGGRAEVVKLPVGVAVSIYHL
jgi:hypothetical protein